MVQEFYPGDIVNNGITDNEVKHYYASKDEDPSNRHFQYPIVEYAGGGWDPVSALTLVKRKSSDIDGTWITLTKKEHKVLKRFGIEFEQRVQVKITGGK